MSSSGGAPSGAGCVERRGRCSPCASTTFAGSVADHDLRSPCGRWSPVGLGDGARRSAYIAPRSPSDTYPEVYGYLFQGPRLAAGGLNDPGAGAEPIVVCGGVPSLTVQQNVAGVGSTLPSASTARTAKLCAPTVRPVESIGLSQSANAPPSSEHSKSQRIGRGEPNSAVVLSVVSDGRQRTREVLGQQAQRLVIDWRGAEHAAMNVKLLEPSRRESPASPVTATSTPSGVDAYSADRMKKSESSPLAGRRSTAPLIWPSGRTITRT
jgi:hypothetical protein